MVASLENLGSFLDKHQVDQVYVALPPLGRSDSKRVLAQLADHLVAVRWVQDPLIEERFPVATNFDGLRIAGVWENRLTGWNAFAKRTLDVVGSLTGLIVLAPVLVGIALAIKFSSRGPILYRQDRMSHDGEVFRMIKFRTMRPASTSDDHFTAPDDDRCTSIGRFLRRTSLDELPQLLNVLTGEMSLVGPRPERPVFIERFRKTMPRYMVRHRVKAGMTGWAQINGWRGNSSLKKRLQYDLFYLSHWSIWFDLKILLLTILRGWSHPNAY